MSQAPAPKSYKFVGGPSRKRRRRTGPKPAPAPGEKQYDFDVTATCDPDPTIAAVEVPQTSSSQALGNGPTIADDQATVSSPAAPLSPLADDAAGGGGNLLDWLHAGSMNPFFEPGLPYANTSFNGGAHCDFQLPFYFGPDIPIADLWNSPPTEEGLCHDMAAPAAAVSEDSGPARGSPKAESVMAGTGDVDVTQQPQEHQHQQQQQQQQQQQKPLLSLPNAPGNISDTISQLLNRYDREFCVMPLTHDFEANPFRFNAETGRGSQLLLHCILALSYKHIHRDTGTCLDEARTHKKKALQMLRDVEDTSQETGSQSPSTFEASFLDAVLILMTLDCATSAHGPWVWYLKRALKMIQATGPLDLQKTPRMQAQIEMLVWWDVTLALTSRRGCVLSESTTISLFSPTGTDAASFYSVSGCPGQLFKYMIRLGAFAREFELAATMTCVKFDIEPVLAVERGIREWSDPDYGYSQQILAELLGGDDDPASLAHYKEDLHHCAEAWRYCLLIYIERVFKWQRDRPVSSMLGFLGRKTLNHVVACRRTTMLQKQLLLPVFLAACETVDDTLRDEARAYCTWWNEKTRYDMFLTATMLLEEVWSNSQDPMSWWGSVIDHKTRRTTSGSGERQYLFG